MQLHARLYIIWNSLAVLRNNNPTSIILDIKMVNKFLTVTMYQCWKIRKIMYYPMITRYSCINTRNLNLFRIKMSFHENVYHYLPILWHVDTPIIFYVGEKQKTCPILSKVEFRSVWISKFKITPNRNSYKNSKIFVILELKFHFSPGGSSAVLLFSPLPYDFPKIQHFEKWFIVSRRWKLEILFLSFQSFAFLKALFVSALFNWIDYHATWQNSLERYQEFEEIK